jgi:hypothetical protein
LTTYSTLLIAGAVAAVGVGLLALPAFVSWFDNHTSTTALVASLGGLLFTTGGLAALWDLRGKRDLIDEVLAKVRVSTEVQASGITKVTMDWLDIPWEDWFNNAKEVDVFISYGSSWRKVHAEKLQDFASKKRNKLRIYLPDPEDEPTMRVLAQRYDYTVEKIKMNIHEMAEEVAKLSGPSSADIRIYYRAGDPTFTCYRFDDLILVTLYSHKRERGNIPSFVIEGGSFHEFFTKDLQAIHKQSAAVSLESLKGSI